MSTANHSRRFVCLVSLALLSVGLSAVSYFYTHSVTGQPAQARATTTPPSVSQGVVCFGHVDLENGVTALYPLQPGRIARLLVHEGEHVSAGTELLRLEDDVAQSQVRAAKLAQESAELQLAKGQKLPEQHRIQLAGLSAAVEASRLQLSSARHLLKRKQELFEKKLINKEEVDITADHVKELEALEQVQVQRLAELKLNDPASDLERLEKEVAMYRERLKQAQSALQECILKAPRDGTVLRLLVGPGDVLPSQTRQPAVLFAADGPRIIRAEVEQEFAGRVSPDQTAVIQDESGLGPTWRGRVLRVADWYAQRRAIMQDPFQFNDVRTVECLITLDPGQPPLRIGQRMRVLLGPVTP